MIQLLKIINQNTRIDFLSISLGKIPKRARSGDFNFTMHNDISFLVDSNMTLYEQQSSLNPNMPLRGLFYFAQLYQIYLTQNDKNVISSQLVKIPTPKFVVFYNGTKDDPDSWKLKLSTAFDHPDESGDFEWTATVINMCPDHNQTLHKNCKPLYHYISFVYRIKNNIDSGMSRNKAIEEAVDFAIKENYLDGFFKTQRAEVIGMILTEFDEEQAHRIWRRDGYTEGREQKAIEAAIAFLKEGDSPEKVSRCIRLPLEKVLELQQSIPVNTK